MDDTKTNECFDVDGRERIEEHSRGREYLLPSRGVWEIEIGEDGEATEFVSVGIWIDGVQEVVEHGKSVGDEGRIINVSEEIRLWKIVEHARTNVKGMVTMEKVSCCPVGDSAEVGMKFERPKTFKEDWFGGVFAIPFRKGRLGRSGLKVLLLLLKQDVREL